MRLLRTEKVRGLNVLMINMSAAIIKKPFATLINKEDQTLVLYKLRYHRLPVACCGRHVVMQVLCKKRIEGNCNVLSLNKVFLLNLLGCRQPYLL